MRLLTFATFTLFVTFTSVPLNSAYAGGYACGDKIVLSAMTSVARGGHNLHVVASIVSLEPGWPACETYEVILYRSSDVKPALSAKRFVLDHQSVPASDIVRRLRADVEVPPLPRRVTFFQWMIRTRPGGREFWSGSLAVKAR